MKIKILFISFLTLTLNNSFSQDENDFFSKGFKEHTLKISPFKPLSTVLPTIELSYEKQLTSYTSAQVTVGYLMENIYLKNNQKGFLISLEAKKYNEINNRFYFSLEAGYYHRHSDEGSLFESNTLVDSNNSPLKYSEAYSNVYNQVYLVPKIGKRTSLGKNFVFDIFFGVGIKWINVKHNNRNFPNDKMPYQKISHIFVPNEVGYYSTIKQGNVFTIKVPLNFRIGYTF